MAGRGWPPRLRAASCSSATAFAITATWPTSIARCQRACSFTTQVRVTGRRWPVEEDLALGKSWFGLADSQVRRYIVLTRHLAPAMAALAVCATTAASARARTGTLARPPASLGELPPQDPGLIPLTAAEIKRVFNLVTRAWQSAPTTCTGPGGGADIR